MNTEQNKNDYDIWFFIETIGGFLIILGLFCLGGYYWPLNQLVYYSNGKSCDAQSAMFFKNNYPEEASSTAYSYTDHYNKALVQCFILITYQEASSSYNWTELYDAYLDKRYASYSSDQNNGYLYDIGDESSLSKAEFNEFVAWYMEN